MTTVHDLYERLMRRTFAATPWTGEKNASVVAAFWKLLISGGVKFQLSDLKEIKAWSAADTWRPGFYGPDEGHYGLAVHESNISFCRCYEAYLGRKPFITKGIGYGYGHSGYVCHGSRKTQGRLVVGAQFLWDGRQVTVTSFKDEKQSLVACVYYAKTEDEKYERTKIKKRYTISIAEFAKARKKIKRLT